MELLPDEVLLQVLGRLDTRQLLRVRRVCRQWHCLALDPDAWRHRDLECFDEDAYGVSLRRAPCARSLSVMERHWEMAAATGCAARRLSVTMRASGDATVARATDVIRRQVQLGRLEDLSVSVCFGSSGGRRAFMAMMRVVNSAGTLARVSIDHTLPLQEAAEPGDAACPAAAPPARLTHLTYTSAVQDSGAELLLRSHAATLEVARLRNTVGNLDWARLPAFPSLRSLECPVMQGMECLLRCPRLERLKLTVDLPEGARRDQPGLAGVRQLLRDATQLKSLVFVYGNFDKREADLVLSLGAASPVRPRALELLTFCYSRYLPKEGRDVLQRNLSLVLPRLPRLAKLALSFPPSSELLASIDPCSAPSLRRLASDFAWEEGLCGHCWWHSAEVRALMQRHPSLHLVTERCVRSCGRGFCVGNCHQLPTGKVGSSGHPDDQPCDASLGHGDPSVTWITAL
ncbi:hypothetical protein ONE63_010319 [Megalurothrips usitatus]|uniref:F-box domain-containing protein n=1 Tax=Megalurothrips usitatus TaxID=439358 RepID=A0AAV7XP61_9NEOP|nr:hypothetical protein ONE63_010319 [Megalurothrips usitatus]